MFKTLEAKWNSKTPVFLHNRTKENLIFQLTLAVLLFLGMEVKSRINERREAREFVQNYPNN